MNTQIVDSVNVRDVRSYDREVQKSEPGRPADPRAGAPPAEPAADSALVKAAVEQSGTQVSGDRTIEFSFDQDSQRVVVKVKSADTGEIVRQIPPKEYLQFVAKFRELFGVVLDEQA